MQSQAAKDARRIRDRAKKTRRRVRKRDEKLAAKAATGKSKTDPTYRRMLPPIPEMTKNELRAIITQAVLNTAGMTA